MGRVNVDTLALEPNLAGIGRVQAEEDFHEGRFAGSIFAYDCMRLPALDLKAHPVQRLHSREGLGQIFDLQERFRLHARSRIQPQMNSDEHR